MSRKLSKWILVLINLLSLVMILSPTVTMLVQEPMLLRSLLPVVFREETGSVLLSSESSVQAENMILKKLGEQEHLRKLQVDFRRFSGKTLQEGIFLTEDAMYENIDIPDDLIANRNAEGMLEFVYRYYIPTYTMIVPTACAIKQDEITANARLFNQKGYIDDIYRRISGVITSCDAYSVLFASLEEYIYYRTHPELTGLGGYYLYTVLADKMSFRERTLAQFEQKFLDHEYYGDLYEKLQYSGAEPDIVSYYRMSMFDRQYTLTRFNEDGSIRIYNDLIVEEMIQDDPTNAVLGGAAPMITIKVDSPYRDKLLIFADETVKSYIPFLAAEYSEITIIDLATVTEKQLKSLSVSQYDQVIFSYSLDNFSQVDFSEQLLYLANK